LSGDLGASATAKGLVMKTVADHFAETIVAAGVGLAKTNLGR
jgi:hypothetical protein